MKVTCLNLVLVRIWERNNNNNNNKDIDKRRREVAIGKVEAYLCLTPIVKELKIRVEHGRVVTTLNTIKH